MEIRHGRESDLACIKEIWGQCFGTDKFCEWFFSNLYDPNHLRVLETEGQVVSMAFCFPRGMILRGIELKGWYLYGIGTHISHRKKGYAEKLISVCVEEARQNSIDVCFLIPAQPSLFAFYKKRGFTVTVTRAEEQGITDSASRTLALAPMREADIPRINAIYEAAFKHTGFVKREAADWKLIAEDFRMGNGDISLLMRGETLIGYACTVTENRVLHIRELGLCGQENAVAICRELSAIANTDEWQYTHPGDGAPFAMVFPLGKEAEISEFALNCDLLYN